MLPRRISQVAMVLGAALTLSGQTARSVIGTVGEIRAQASEIEVKPDNGPAATVKLTPETQYQRVSPGEKDLRNAAVISIGQLAAGDRVLVTFKPDTTEARRIVVMPAAEIAKRNETDRQDWTRRGVSGVVAAKNGNRITLRMRSFQGETQATVTVAENTAYRRYAPDSVKFADARPSTLAEIGAGDQLRARGQKSEDGLAVTAEEVVFGTFLTKAGAITAVSAETGEVTIKDLDTGKPLVVKVTADSQLKRMPSFGGRPGGAPPFAGGGPGRGPGGFGPGGPGGQASGRPGGPPDLSQMLERMPPAKVEELKAGETIVVSSTKGSSKDSITAIMLLANADMLIRMATMQSDRTRNANPGGPGIGAGMGGLGGGLNGLDMPGMIP